MKIEPSFPLTGYVAAGALVVGFAGGWYVEGLRWDHSLLKAERSAVKQERRQQAHVEKEATSYETERTQGEAERVQVEMQIRTVFRDRIVPAECAAPAADRRVLAEAVDRANTLASGESGNELPDAPAAPGPVDRPRAVNLGSNDDRDLWRLREQAPPYSAGVAEEPLKLEIPDVAFGGEVHSPTAAP